MRDEARHNLILGIVGTIVEHPEVYPEYDLWVVEIKSRVIGAAARTPPFNLVLADPLDDGVVEALVDHLGTPGTILPGVVANRPHAERFADRWSATTGAQARLRMDQGVYALRELRRVPPASGRARRAGPADRDLLSEWLTDFSDEALPEDVRDDRRADRMLDVRLTGNENAGMWLWEDGGEPVSLAGFGGRTPNGVRVGPVYTPKDRRRNGYATALVASMSAWLLVRGHRFCFLYTDLANPTSNAIYERIGYERICESAEYGFDPIA